MFFCLCGCVVLVLGLFALLLQRQWHIQFGLCQLQCIVSGPSMPSLISLMALLAVSIASWARRSFFIFGRSGLSVISWYLTVSHFLRISFFIVIILSSGFVSVGFCVLPALSGNVGVFSSTFTSTISCLSVSSIPGLYLLNSSGVGVVCLTFARIVSSSISVSLLLLIMSLRTLASLFASRLGLAVGFSSRQMLYAALVVLVSEGLIVAL